MEDFESKDLKNVKNARTGTVMKKNALGENAPIIITTLSRYEHLKRCIESLKNCTLSEETELYIGVDHPYRADHTEGNNQIIEYLENLSGFKKIIVVKHPNNMGSERNFLYMRDLVYEKYDYYIATEDDNEFAPDFLDFMNKALSAYKDDPHVLAVSGYRYPFETGMAQKSNCVFRLNTYFSGFGYGIWKEKEMAMRKALTLDRFKGYYNDGSRMIGLSINA